MKTKVILGLVAALASSACSGGAATDSGGGRGTGGGTGTAQPPAPTPPTPPTAPAPGPSAGATPASLPQGLLIATSQFRVEDGRVTATPGPARLELLTREGGEWRTEVVEDATSNVFHKAMVYAPPGQAPGILTLGGMAAAVKLWRPGAQGWTSETLWTEDFGGRFNRMRDAEIRDVTGDGPAIVVATHDQGVVGLVHADRRVEPIDRQPNTFVHEIEVGDLDGDGTLEIYATPSEPNDLDGGEQHGQVVRYVPGANQGRTVVADLGNRHAKEILVADVDGDGRDELYVAVEALTRGTGADVEIVEPVEIRRYDADTAPDARVVVATIRDRLTRFLTVGDLDGDGRREMIAAAFSSGVWLLRPGRDPRGEWSIENVDRDSSGFEHAALVADLDADGKGELYVAADEQAELRRYVWVDGRPRREVLLHRPVARAIMTWNLAPFPLSLRGR